MSDVLLCDISDANQILQDQRKAWVLNILELLEIPEEIINCHNIDQLRGGLNHFGIHIETLSGGEEINIYRREWYGDQNSGGWLPPEPKHLIAQWKRPKYIRKVEGEDVYYELHLNEWSMLRTKNKT
jgi:hypothetical protein